MHCLIFPLSLFFPGSTLTSFSLLGPSSLTSGAFGSLPRGAPPSSPSSPHGSSLAAAMLSKGQFAGWTPGPHAPAVASAAMEKALVNMGGAGADEAAKPKRKRPKFIRKVTCQVSRSRKRGKS